MTEIKPYSGPPILGLLEVAFIVLKLLNVIEWSWWWVLAPFWIILIFIAIVTIGAVIMVIYTKNVK